MSSENEILPSSSSAPEEISINTNNNMLIDDDEDALLGLTSSDADQAQQFVDIGGEENNNNKSDDESESDNEKENGDGAAAATGEDDAGETEEARAIRKAEKRARKEAKKEKKRLEKEKKRQEKESKEEAKRTGKRRNREDDENAEGKKSKHSKKTSDYLQQTELDTTIVSESKSVKHAIQKLLASKQSKSLEELTEMATSLMAFKSDVSYVKSVLSDLTSVAVTAKDLTESGIGVAVGYFLTENDDVNENENDNNENNNTPLIRSEVQLLANAILQFWFHACLSEKEREQILTPAETQIEQQQQKNQDDAEVVVENPVATTTKDNIVENVADEVQQEELLNAVDGENSASVNNAIADDANVENNTPTAVEDDDALLLTGENEKGNADASQ